MRHHSLSPAQSAAKTVKKRYAKKSPRKSNRLRRALFEAGEKQVSIRKAAKNMAFQAVSFIGDCQGKKKQTTETALTQYFSRRSYGKMAKGNGRTCYGTQTT